MGRKKDKPWVRHQAQAQAAEATHNTRVTLSQVPPANSFTNTTKKRILTPAHIKHKITELLNTGKATLKDFIDKGYDRRRLKEWQATAKANRMFVNPGKQFAVDRTSERALEHKIAERFAVTNNDDDAPMPMTAEEFEVELNREHRQTYERRTGSTTSPTHACYCSGMRRLHLEFGSMLHSLCV